MLKGRKAQLIDRTVQQMLYIANKNFKKLVLAKFTLCSNAFKIG